MRVLHLDASHRLADVKEIVHFGLLDSLLQLAVFTHLLQPLIHRCCIVREHQLVNAFFAQRRQTLSLQQSSYFVESNLRFVVFRVNHAAKVVQTERKTKENTLFLCFSEVQPTFTKVER